MPINYQNYPKNWKSEIRPQILERANNKCEFCGIENHITIIRGKVNGYAVYQKENGDIYDAEDSTYICNDYFGEIE